MLTRHPAGELPAPPALNRRDLLTLALLTPLISAAITGCSDSDSEGGGGGVATYTGGMTLPAGVNHLDLEVWGSGDAGTLTASSFTVASRSQAPSLVSLLNPGSGKMVYMLLLDPKATEHRIDARSTAEAVLFLSLAGFSLSDQDRTDLLNLIKASTEAATLAAVMTAEFAANPYSINEPGPALLSAISSAALSLAAPSAAGMKATAAAMKSTDAWPAAQAAALPDPLLLIEPANEVDGFTCVQATDKIGFAVQNVRRRFGYAYTYLVGHVNDAGAKTSVPPEQIGGALEVPLTRTLLHLPNGWSQVTSASVPLAVRGDDSKTLYETVVLGAVFGGVDPPPFRLDRYQGEVEKWRAEVARLRQAATLGSVVETVLEVLGLGGATFSYATLSAEIARILGGVTPFSTLLLNAAENTGKARLVDLVSGVLRTITSADSVLAQNIPELLPLMGKAAAEQNVELTVARMSAKSITRLRAGLVVLVVLGVIELADVVAISRDTSRGESANLFSQTVFQPKVRLTPGSQDYKPGDRIAFSVSVPNKQGMVLAYHWKCTGSNLVTLDDGVVFDKLDFESTGANVTLSTTPSTVSDLVVSVEVYNTAGGSRVFVGSGQSTLKYVAGQTSLTFSTYTSAVLKDDGGNGQNNRNNFTVFAIASFTPKKPNYRYELRYAGNPQLNTTFDEYVLSQSSEVMHPDKATTANGGSLSVPLFDAAPNPATAGSLVKLYNLGGGVVGFMASYVARSTFADPASLIADMTAMLQANLATLGITLTEKKVS